MNEQLQSSNSSSNIAEVFTSQPLHNVLSQKIRSPTIQSHKFRLSQQQKPQLPSAARGGRS